VCEHKEQLAQLWTYTYEEAARHCLTNWLLALRWQRLPAFQKLGRMLTRHLGAIVHYCHEKVPFGTVDAIDGNIRALLRRGRGDRDHEYLLLKVQKATASRIEECATGGGSRFILRPLCPPDRMLAQLALAAEHVIPEYHRQ
jgi:Transposase